MSDKESKAFEFVIGSLSEEERAVFESQLASDKDQEDDVTFWENHLSALNTQSDTLQPRTQTWDAIKAETLPRSVETPSSTAGASNKWLSWLPWGVSIAMSFALVIALSVGQFKLDDSLAVPVDYVAVLTDDSGQAMLTAITEGDSKNMWLQWNEIDLKSDQDLQIWALSKSDKQIRSIAIVNNQNIQTLQLSDAHWRLITDAESLILSVEDAGGSALDEPSDVILAKGVCVRLNRQEKTT